MKTPPIDSYDQVADRHLNLLIEEVLGTQADAGGPRTAATRREDPAITREFLAAPKHRLVAAACVILGLGTVVGTGLIRGEPVAPGSQKRELGAEIVVDSLADIRGLPPDTDNVKLTLHTAEAVRGLVRLHKLRRLDASFATHDEPNPDRPAFFPKAAEPLGLLTSLEELDLSGHVIRGVTPLATLSRLRRLRLYHCLMEASSLAVLRHFRKLEDLVIDCTKPLDEGMSYLDMRHPEHGIGAVVASPKLQSLCLTCCIIDKAGIRAIAERPLRKLSVYRLGRTHRVGNDFDPVLPATYAALATIDTLEELTFSCYADAKLLRGLRRLPRLRKLDLDGTVGMRGAPIGKALAALPFLRELNVEFSDIDEAALLAMTESRTVEDLGLGGDSECTDKVLAAVSTMRQLRRLAIALHHGVTDAGLSHLRGLNLREFSMLHARQVTPKGLLQLPTSIRNLGLDVRASSGAIFQRLAKVESLRLRCWITSTTPAIRQVFDSPVRHTLRQFALRYDVGAPDSLELLAKFPKLEAVDASECASALSTEVVTALKQRGVAVKLREERR